MASGGRVPYLGQNGAAGGEGRTPYLGSGVTANTGRTPYLGVAPKSTGGSPPKKSGGGGFLHWIGTKAGLAAHDIAQMPAGVIQVGVGAEKDYVNQLKRGDINPLNILISGKNTRRAEKGQVVGGYQSLRHPGRDPFQTAMTASMLLGGTAGALGRAAEVGRTGDLGALARAPEVRPNILKVGDERTPVQIGNATKNVAARHLVQRPYVRTLQRTLDKPPAEQNPLERAIAGHAARRIRGSHAEDARQLARTINVPAGRVEAAGRRLGIKGTPGARDRLHQAALELVASQTMPEEAAAAHLGYARENANELNALQAKPEPSVGQTNRMAELHDAIPRNQMVAKVYQEVGKRNMLREDNGRVVVNAEQHPALEAARLARNDALAKGEQIASDYKLLPHERAEVARNAPAQYRAGATYVTPTRARLGIKSPAVERQEAKVAGLQKMHDTALKNVAAAAEKKAGPEDVVIGQRIVGPGRRFPARRATTKTVQRGATAEEAQGRLTSLEKAHAKQLDTMAHAHFGPIEKGEASANAAQRALFRKQLSGRDKLGRLSGASSEKAEFTKTPAELRRDAIEQTVLAAAKKNPEAPGAAQFLGRVSEIDKLRQALNPEMFEPIDKSKLGTTPTEVKVPGRPAYSGPGRAVQAPGAARAERIGSSLSMEKDKLQRMQEAAARRIEPTGIVGGAGARPGESYVSYRSFEPNAPGQTAPEVTRNEPRSPITTQSNRGQNIRLGKVPTDLTGQAGRHYRELARFVQKSRRLEQVASTGNRLRRSMNQELVQVPGETHAAVSDVIRQEMGKGNLGHDTLEGLHAALQSFTDQLVPKTVNGISHERDPVGTPAPDGHVWVDKNITGDLGKMPGGGTKLRVVRGIDNVNSAVTAATVYYKVGHAATRAFTNATTNLMNGSLNPVAMKSAYLLYKDLTPAERDEALAISGQHGFASMPARGKVGAVASHGARFWAHRVDAPSRFLNVAYEARKAGYDTPAKFRDYLSKALHPEQHNMDAAEQSKITWIGRRANRASIMYDGLNGFEKDWLTRAVWFYPWIKGAVRWAGHTALEHPIKTGVATNLAVTARKQQMKDLGPLPSYENALTQIAGAKGRGPLVMDPSTLTPYGTTASVLNAAERPQQLEGFLNPVYGGVAHLATGTNQYGQKTTRPYSSALAAIGAAAPEYQVGAALLHRNQNQSKRMFRTTPLNTLARAFYGPTLPRRLNRAAAAKSYGREVTNR